MRTRSKYFGTRPDAAGVPTGGGAPYVIMFVELVHSRPFFSVCVWVAPACACMCIKQQGNCLRSSCRSIVERIDAIVRFKPHACAVCTTSAVVHD